MDTHQVELPVSRAEAVRRAVSQVVAGGDAVLSVGFDAAAVLDDVSDLLADGPLRVLRCAAAGQGGLSLSGLLAQVTGRPDLGGHDDEVLQRGFEALTTPGPGFDAVVLLIDGAEALQRSAMRYLQFVARTAPGPRLVLACEGQLPDLYDGELAPLRTRLAAMPALVVGGLGSSPSGTTVGGVAGPVPLPSRAPQVVSDAPAWPGAGTDAVPLPGAATVLAMPRAGAPISGAMGFVPLVVPRQADQPNPAAVGDTTGAALPGGSGPTSVWPAGVVAALVVPATPDRDAAGLGRPALEAGGAGLPRVRRAVRVRTVAVWAAAGAAMAACVVIGVAIGRYQVPAGTTAQAGMTPAGAADGNASGSVAGVDAPVGATVGSAAASVPLPTALPPPARSAPVQTATVAPVQGTPVTPAPATAAPAVQATAVAPEQAVAPAQAAVAAPSLVVAPLVAAGRAGGVVPAQTAAPVPAVAAVQPAAVVPVPAAASPDVSRPLVGGAAPGLVPAVAPALAATGAPGPAAGPMADVPLAVASGPDPALTAPHPAPGAPIPAQALRDAASPPLGSVTPGVVAPGVVAPGSVSAGSVAPVQADVAGPDAFPRRTGPSHRPAARPADSALARPRHVHEAEPHVREAVASNRETGPSRPRRIDPAQDSRDRRAAEDGRQVAYPPPVYSAPYRGEPDERRPIIGTFSTDPTGARTFRFSE